MRVVAGEFKGRRLAGPGGGGARPTSDKVREALFSILGDVEGARVLDLFAGTGALAIEALSRGAAEATLVERDRRTAAQAQVNLSQTVGAGSPRATLVRGDALRFLERAAGREFDLVLIDPPYRDAPALAARLDELLPPLLAGGARIVTESDRRDPLTLDQSRFQTISEHRYGDTLLRTVSPHE